MSTPSTEISVYVGTDARKAHLARTGADPGQYIKMTFAVASEAVRAALARYYSPDTRSVMMTDATDTTIEAISAALLARVAEDDAREQKHAEMRVQIERAARLRQESASREQAVRQEKAQKEAAKEAQAAKKERAKRDYITSWLRDHGTAVEQAQWGEELLDRREVLSRISDDAFASAPPALTRRICKRRYHACGRTTRDTIPKATYSHVVELRRSGYTVTNFETYIPCLLPEHEEYCGDGDGLGEPIVTAEISVQVGPFHCTRVITLPSAWPAEEEDWHARTLAVRGLPRRDWGAGSGVGGTDWATVTVPCAPDSASGPGRARGNWTMILGGGGGRAYYVPAEYVEAEDWRMPHLNLAIPEALHRAAVVAAKRDDRSLTRWILRAMRAQLARETAADAAQATAEEE